MDKEVQTQHPEKRPYTTPRLVKYGDVRTMTQAGSTGPNENAQTTNPSKKVSDPVAKENVVRIGTHPLGFGIYLFDYKPEFRETCGSGRQLGYMADEVERVLPHAVSYDAAGFRMVDYGVVGCSR